MSASSATTQPKRPSHGPSASQRPPARLPDASSRERIHAAALSLFARYGYEGVSLQMIADAVGLHKSTLFHHYASKLALVDEVLDDAVGRVLGHVAPLETEEQPRLETLLGAVDALVDRFSNEPEAARLLVSAMASPDDSELRQAGSAGHTLRLYGILASWLDRARRSGAIRA